MAFNDDDHTPTKVLLARTDTMINEIRDVLDIIGSRNDTNVYGDRVIGLDGRLDDASRMLTEFSMTMDQLDDDLDGITEEF